MTIDTQPVHRGVRIGSIILLFALVGPPIGAFAVLTWPIVTDLVAGKGLSPVSDFAGTFLIFAVSSYMVGLIPASLAGLLLGLLLASRGRIPWYMVLLVGASVGVLSNVLLFRGLDMSTIHVVVMCTVPTIVCSLIVRVTERFWRAADSSRPEGVS